MRWRSGRTSENVEDRRGRRPSGSTRMPSGFTLPGGRRRISRRGGIGGLGGIVLVLVLFSGYLQSACGLAQSATGPFYCPLDEKVCIDLSFYDELRSRFRAPGDFAQAYLIAHEIGHHVQNQLGILDRVQDARARVGAREANALSVRLELQADCLAGVWAYHADNQRHLLEEGDIEEGLNAASAIGDDRMQRRSRGYVVPDAFTHGSSDQRVRWFRRGLATGRVQACNTFTAERL
jgi:predicted metalloprotease